MEFRKLKKCVGKYCKREFGKCFKRLAGSSKDDLNKVELTLTFCDEGDKSIEKYSFPLGVTIKEVISEINFRNSAEKDKYRLESSKY